MRKFCKIFLSVFLIIQIFFGSAIASEKGAIGKSEAKGAPQEQAVFTSKQVTDIQNIVHDYLIKNPKILLKMSRSLQELKEQEMLQMQAETKGLLSKYKKELFDSKQHAIFGNPNGQVVMVKFFDYQCAHCKSMNLVVKELVAKNADLKVIFIEWPLFGASSLDIAKAALASRKQNKYMQFHDALLAEEGPITSLQQIFKIAKTVGLDEKKIEKDMNSQEVQDFIQKNVELAQKLKLVAAPAFAFSNVRGDKFNFMLGKVDLKEAQKIIDKIRSKK